MKQRIPTAIILIAVTFLLIWISFWTHLALAAIIGIGILYETLRMANSKHIYIALSIFAGIIASLTYIHRLSPGIINVQNTHPITVIIYILTFIIVGLEFTLKKPLFVNNTVFFIARSLLISTSTSLSFLSIATTSKEILLFFLVLIWTCDISALFVGRSFGKHKLSSSSPKKTIEGALGGLLIPIGISASLFMTDYANLAPAKILLTFVVALSSQISDLHESVLKRFFNIKDSSSLLPGHGGIYDRCDSYVLSLPLLALLLPYTLLPLLPS
jgi:phosphatidate cytidylyltransferase